MAAAAWQFLLSKAPKDVLDNVDKLQGLKEEDRFVAMDRSSDYIRF
jgi:hypothetical protein